MIGVFGGTFDPVHFGHLKPVLEVCHQLRLTEVRMVLAAHPPHRPPPVAGVQHRWRMLNLVARADSALAADDTELKRPGLSYTVDTLLDLRSALGEAASLSLIVGADAFASMSRWHRAPDILKLVNLVVMSRPGYRLPAQGEEAEWLARCGVTDPDALKSRPAGNILVHPVTPVDISSTRVRQVIAAGQAPRYLMPGMIWNYIRRHQLYGAQTRADESRRPEDLSG